MPPDGSVWLAIPINRTNFTHEELERYVGPNPNIGFITIDEKHIMVVNTLAKNESRPFNVKATKILYECGHDSSVYGNALLMTKLEAGIVENVIGQD